MNQGVLAAAVTVAYTIIAVILSLAVKVPSFSWYRGYTYSTPGWLTAILVILALGVPALWLYGILNAVAGKTKPLPLLGDKINIFK